MSGIPSGTELVRPLVPARDFDQSKRFILQRYYQDGAPQD